MFIDEEYSVYVSDDNGQGVMKWMTGAKDGIVVASGQGQGDRLTQLHGPQRVIVDHFGHVYVADKLNNRIMRWPKESKEGIIIGGGNG